MIGKISRSGTGNFLENLPDSLYPAFAFLHAGQLPKQAVWFQGQGYSPLLLQVAKLLAGWGRIHPGAQFSVVFDVFLSRYVPRRQGMPWACLPLWTRFPEPPPQQQSSGILPTQAKPVCFPYQFDIWFPCNSHETLSGQQALSPPGRSIQFSVFETMTGKLPPRDSSGTLP